MLLRILALLLSTLLLIGCEHGATRVPPAQTLSVLFEDDSSELTADALTAIWEYARNQRTNVREIYILLASPDSPPSSSGESLRMRRRNAVREALTLAGIDDQSFISFDEPLLLGEAKARQLQANSIVVVPKSSVTTVIAAMPVRRPDIVVGSDYNSPWPGRR